MFPVIINGKTLQIEYSETEIWGEKYQIYQVSDLSFIKENIKKNARKGMAVSGLVVMFGGALLYLLLKRMLSPLETLTVASKALSEGNYKERVRIKADGEIGILAEQFNGMADKIEEKMENLHAMNEQQLRLIGSLSHEIKTPMTAIGGYTQMLRYRSDLKPEQKEKALMYMDSECRRLSSLAGKMMELCGLYEEKKIKVKEENVYSVVGECLEKMAFRMKEAGVSAEILTENKEIAYPVDRDLFTSYVWNILENAVRASSIGGKIRIFIEEDSLSIADEGIGIPAKDLDKVQEAFYMVEKSRSRKRAAQGLAWHYVSRLPEYMALPWKSKAAPERGRRSFGETVEEAGNRGRKECRKDEEKEDMDRSALLYSGWMYRVSASE